MKTETKISFTLSELESKANDWCKQKAVITDDGEAHMQSQIEHAKILAFVRSLFSNKTETINGIQADLDAREKEKDKYYDQLSDVVEHAWTLTPEQENQFKAADMILVQNKKDCEQFKGRDGI